MKSCTIMHKVYPTFQCHIFLPSQSPHCIPKRLGRSLVIRRPSPSIREHRPVKVSSDVWSVDVGHCPHRPNYTSESAILNGRGEVESLVSDAIFRDLCSMTSGEERKFGSRKLRSYDIEQRKSCSLI